MTVSPYDRLGALGIMLPRPPTPIGNFVPYVQEGSLLYMSGQGPIEADGTVHTGKVGAGVAIEDARRHARLVGINLLACSAASTADHRVTWTTLRLLATRRDPTYHLCSLYPRMTPPPFVPLSTKVVSFRPQLSYGAGSRASPTTPRRGYVPGLLQAGTQNPCPRDR